MVNGFTTAACDDAPLTRLAMFSPLSPVQTAIADYTEGLLPHLARHFDITVIIAGNYNPTHPMFRPGAQPVIRYITYRDFQRCARDFEIIVYQLGDEATIHGYMFDAIPKYPGFIVLHDLVLHHAVIGMTLGRGDKAGYLACLKQAYGAEGQQVAQSVLSGRGDEPNLFLRYPVVEPWLAGSLGVIGHNNYVVDQVRERTPGIPVRRIVQPFFLPEGFPPGFDGGAFRRELGLTDDPVVASFGFFIPDKRLGLVMRAFKRLLRRHPRATYLLVGGSSPHYDLQGELNAMGLGGRVRLTGWQSQVSFVKHLFVPDVAVHLRYPHIGGTPYTPVRLLGLGIPTIVSDIEPLAELPPDAVVRVRPNEPDEESMLFAAMDYLLTRPDVAAAMGKNGQGYIADNHNLPAVIEQFVDFFAPASQRKSAARPTPTRRTRAQTLSARMSSLAGSALADSGLRESSEALLAPVARAIRDLSRPPRDEVQ